MSSSPEYDLIVVGAGAAGLTAALTAAERGERVLVLESEDSPGGRLRTDRTEDFLFDRGFQILLTAYPGVRRWLDLSELAVRAFEPGAHVLLPDGGRTTVADPLRAPLRVFDTLASPIGSLRDKLLLLRLVTHVRTRSPEQLFATEETTTERFLVGYGFSARMIDLFFRPFYGGIFLERELATSARFFLFTFKMFAEGDAVLPRRGIQAVAEQLARRLPPDSIRFGASAKQVSSTDVTLADGSRLAARHVVDTRPPATPAAERGGRWLQTINLYVATATTSLPPRLITLVPGGGPVNNIADLSSVQPAWAPVDTRLLSLTLYDRGGRTTEDYFRAAYRALFPWLGAELDGWRPLRHYEIPRALPFTRHAEWTAHPARWREAGGAVRGGDWRLHPSLQAAMTAGELMAVGPGSDGQ